VNLSKWAHLNAGVGMIMKRNVVTFGKLKGIVKNKTANAIELITQQIQAIFLKKKPGKYRYITIGEVIEFNKLVTSQGGLLRDQAGLEGAIMRPQTADYYEDADIAKQVALLIDGVAMVHAFIDGNKRTALLTGVTFLDINGYKLRDAQGLLGRQIEELVVGRDIELFTKWLRSHIQIL
jgi:death on curing protein